MECEKNVLNGINEQKPKKLSFSTTFKCMLVQSALCQRKIQMDPQKKGVSCVDLGSGFVFWMLVPALIDLP